MHFGHHLILQELMLMQKPSLKQAYMCYLEVVLRKLLSNNNSTNEIGTSFCFSLDCILLIIQDSVSLITQFICYQYFLTQHVQSCKCFHNSSPPFSTFVC